MSLRRRQRNGSRANTPPARVKRPRRLAKPPTLLPESLRDAVPDTVPDAVPDTVGEHPYERSNFCTVSR
jgi:hypothetical protein